MKNIIIKNLTIQFDTFDNGADKHTALNMLDEINSVLQERFPDLTPQIFVGIIDDDIEIADEDDEKEDCMEAGIHLASCDEDGFCNGCGYQ